METQLVDLTIITFNIARGGTFEQALRVDRPPSALVFATSSSLPATQGQRSKAVLFLMGASEAAICCSSQTASVDHDSIPKD